MFFKARITVFFSLLLCFAIKSFSQEVASPYHWKVSARKTGDGIYELTFSSDNVAGWQLYAP